MLKVTKCIGVKSFVEALINMECELKNTSGCKKKKMCKNFMVIRHSIKELLAKSMVTRPMKCIVVAKNLFPLFKFVSHFLLSEAAQVHDSLPRTSWFYYHFIDCNLGFCLDPSLR